MKPSRPFRLWVQRIWIDNTEEHLTYGELPYTIQEYWAKYKWWLRREYRHQMDREAKLELHRRNHKWAQKPQQLNTR